MDGYILVVEETLDKVTEATGLPRHYWEHELKRFDGFGRYFVVFPKDGQIVFTTFDKGYSVPFVMKQKFGLEAQ